MPVSIVAVLGHPAENETPVLPPVQVVEEKKTTSHAASELIQLNVP